MKECSCYLSIAALTELVTVKYRCVSTIFILRSLPCCLWQDCVPSSSTLFNVVFFSFAQCVVFTQPTFFFLRENCFLCSCRLSVSMGEGEFSSSYFTILNQNPKQFYSSLYTASTPMLPNCKCEYKLESHFWKAVYLL